ncbi:class I SAM-dependent methyltransferase [Algihabitans albus]|uniref:class I SAM-dependent methyltransferase n=1 Tax=Algihabitans albus TaxID=2164067 RepID=UPI000E5C9F38|nr:class I SAM-dependent methyltransferase [Algihabitans albus]
MVEIDETAVAEAWDGNAAAWIAQVRAGRDFYREAFNNPAFLEFLPELTGLSVLDLGCGEGRNTRLFAQRGAHMTGIDISPRLIAAAQAAETAEPLGIGYHIGSYTDLDGFSDSSFDAAVSTMALMDSPGFDRAAQSVHRVLRRGGWFCLSVLHPCFVTPGYRWLRDSGGNERGLVVADYFSDQVSWEQWRFKSGERSEDQGQPESEGTDFTSARMPYRLEDYVNGLCEASFRIRVLQEPRPTEAMVEAHPRLGRLRRHAPIFLYLYAVKE